MIQYHKAVQIIQHVQSLKSKIVEWYKLSCLHKQSNHSDDLFVCMKCRNCVGFNKS